ncbi:hypothetical protein [Pseudoalteromonas amylolytica]|nr:hypothetical protein [Pseudoalteromonas amylolytica]
MTQESHKEHERSAGSANNVEQVKHKQLMPLLTLIAQKLQLGQAIKTK